MDCTAPSSLSPFGVTRTMLPGCGILSCLGAENKLAQCRCPVRIASQGTYKKRGNSSPNHMLWLLKQLDEKIYATEMGSLLHSPLELRLARACNRYHAPWGLLTSPHGWPDASWCSSMSYASSLSLLSAKDHNSFFKNCFIDVWLTYSKLHMCQQGNWWFSPCDYSIHRKTTIVIKSWKCTLLPIQISSWPS